MTVSSGSQGDDQVAALVETHTFYEKDVNWMGRHDT